MAFDSRLLQDIAPVIVVKIMALYRNRLMRLGIVVDRMLLAFASDHKPILQQIPDCLLLW